MPPALSNSPRPAQQLPGTATWVLAGGLLLSLLCLGRLARVPLAAPQVSHRVVAPHATLALPSSWRPRPGSAPR